MKTVSRVLVKTKDAIMECRYDVEKSLLYQQNRSRDMEICLDDYLDRRGKTISVAKERGYKVICDSVAITEPWTV